MYCGYRALDIFNHPNSIFKLESNLNAMTHSDMMNLLMCEAVMLKVNSVVDVYIGYRGFNIGLQADMKTVQRWTCDGLESESRVRVVFDSSVVFNMTYFKGVLEVLKDRHVKYLEFVGFDGVDIGVIEMKSVKRIKISGKVDVSSLKSFPSLVRLDTDKFLDLPEIAKLNDDHFDLLNVNIDDTTVEYFEHPVNFIGMHEATLKIHKRTPFKHLFKSRSFTKLHIISTRSKNDYSKLLHTQKGLRELRISHHVACESDYSSLVLRDMELNLLDLEFEGVDKPQSIVGNVLGMFWEEYGYLRNSRVRVFTVRVNSVKDAEWLARLVDAVKSMTGVEEFNVLIGGGKIGYSLASDIVKLVLDGVKDVNSIKRINVGMRIEAWDVNEMRVDQYSVDRLFKDITRFAVDIHGKDVLFNGVECRELGVYLLNGGVLFESDHQAGFLLKPRITQNL